MRLLSASARLPWLLVPPAVFLFFLPFTHTVSVRLLSLFVTLVLVLALWKHYAPPSFPCRAPVLAWAGLALLSLCYAVDVSYSTGEVKNEVGYTLAAFVAFYALTRDELTFRRLLAVVGAGYVVLSLWALVAQLRLQHWDETGYFGGSASYATYVITLAPLLLLLLRPIGEQHPRRYLTMAALATLGVVCAFFTWQRIVWPVFGLQVVLALTLLQRKRLITVPGRWLTVILAAGMVSSVIAWETISQYRFQQDVIESTGTDVRVAKLGLVAERILEAPLTGHGFGRRTMIKVYPELAQDNPLFWHAHNIFLNYGIQLGIPGILAIASVFLCLTFQFYRLYRSSDATLSVVGIVGIVMVVGVVARNQTNDMFGRDLALLFWTLAGLLLGYGRRRLAQTAA
jgi:O-antigen ligase